MLNFCDLIQAYVFTTNHHLNESLKIDDYRRPRSFLPLAVDSHSMTISNVSSKATEPIETNFI